MSGFVHSLREFLFGPDGSGPPAEAIKQWREAIHESKGVAQASIAEARKSKKQSDEATRVAESAITKLEEIHRRGKDGS